MTGNGTMVRLLIAGMVAALAGCGGVDVGNPPNSITGMVYRQSPSDESGAGGAMVILAERGDFPGIGEQLPCNFEGSIGTCPDFISFFDTTYTDENGVFCFNTVYPGSYVIVASQNGLLALEYIEQKAFRDREAALYLTEPAAIHVTTYDKYDPSSLHFLGVRVAGTGFIDFADDNGDMVLQGVPAGELDLIFYRSDDVNMTFPSFSTESGRSAELYVDPAMPVSYWTPHPSGYRDPLGRPYIMESYIPALAGDTSAYSSDGKLYDLRISFSHAMEAISTGRAVHGFSDDSSLIVKSWWWEGSNVLYLSFCVTTALNSCSTQEDRFSTGVTYGVTIDTSAQTALGVHFAHEAQVRFVLQP